MDGIVAMVSRLSVTDVDTAHIETLTPEQFHTAVDQIYRLYISPMVHTLAADMQAQADMQAERAEGRRMTFDQTNLFIAAKVGTNV